MRTAVYMPSARAFTAVHFNSSFLMNTKYLCVCVWESSGKMKGKEREAEKSQNVKCGFAYVLTPDYEVICILKWHSNLCHAKLKRKSSQTHTLPAMAHLPFSKIHNKFEMFILWSATHKNMRWQANTVTAGATAF